MDSAQLFVLGIGEKQVIFLVRFVRRQALTCDISSETLQNRRKIRKATDFNLRYFLGDAAKSKKICKFARKNKSFNN